MKRFALLLFATVISTIVMAQRKETTILEVAGNLATPLTVHTSKGTYTVHSSTELNGSVSVRSAEDANGNKVVVPNGDYKSHTSNGKSEYTRIYRFRTLYNNSSSSSSSGSYSSRNNGGSSYGGGNSYSQVNPNNARYDRIIEEIKSKCATVSNPNLEGKWGSSYNGNWMFEVRKVNNEYKIVLNPDVFSWDEIIEYPNMIVVYETREFDKREELRKKRLNSYYDDCNENADPGFSKYGKYYYNFQECVYKHIYYLTNSGISNAPTWIHTDNYLNGSLTYSDTEIMESFLTDYKRFQ